MFNGLKRFKTTLNFWPVDFYETIIRCHLPTEKTHNIFIINAHRIYYLFLGTSQNKHIIGNTVKNIRNISRWQ